MHSWCAWWCEVLGQQVIKEPPDARAINEMTVSLQTDQTKTQAREQTLRRNIAVDSPCSDAPQLITDERFIKEVRGGVVSHIDAGWPQPVAKNPE
ncbi:hypothetical protein WL93_10895 [Burkholderia diffusa]|nr:hypothetical protein WL93_10895 [Burkholderia diffusa]